MNLASCFSASPEAGVPAPSVHLVVLANTALAKVKVFRRQSACLIGGIYHHTPESCIVQGNIIPRGDMRSRPGKRGLADTH